MEILNWSCQTDPVVKSIFDDSTSNATYLSNEISNFGKGITIETIIVERTKTFLFYLAQKQTLCIISG